MASPTTSQAQYRPDLAAILEFDLQGSRSEFIGQRLFPPFEVANPAGKYPKIERNELLRNPGENDLVRAPGAGYSKDEFEFTEASYTTEERGREAEVDDRERATYRNYFDMDLVATQRALDQVLRAGEVRVADLAFNTATGIATSAAATVWDADTSTPVDDVFLAQVTVRNATGVVPRTGVCDWEVFKVLQNSEQIVERVKYQGFVDARKGLMSRAAIASALDLDEILVAGDGVLQNASAQGDAGGEVMTPIWDKTRFGVFKTASSNDFRELCIGRTLHWSEDGSELRGRVEQYRNESRRSDVFRVRQHVGEETIDLATGYILTAVNA